MANSNHSSNNKKTIMMSKRCGMMQHVQTSPPETTADLHRIARLAWHNSLPKRGPKMMQVSLGQCLATDRRTMIHAITVELVCVATWLHGGMVRGLVLIIQWS